ncbi:DNA polymerase III, subunits gamma and tau [Thermocrinis albus DSM 14484]|uniref:DNA polymerase III subunit gamma/tau n=1 Tax=Thermocrinis albus (strain DSM 14484 / JCM 11386 / HI 11/12) TaxID=638303 RepID=D3SLB3_THEAH|nr:DNA polymerase III subunit gamma/tau [Thermocrinis albus]ADC89543.1 DNA polymerase III, subunits gamma and tau [Thermocrinis albus DSM 14484]
MYIPFARKYRPKKFSQVVGQETAKRVILNAVRLGKLHHAYLFSGPRGTGKTTLARILTRAVNCLNPQEGEPCGECENCVAIDKGSFPDLVEMDAASNRGIDDIRNLKDAVSYTPLKGKYKVYILDEAHMLTKEAFNALLKTLEEPPPRTIFVLCTTEYEKIPPTILSRCQRIVFSKLEEDLVVSHLFYICREEGLNCEEKALRIIARASDGAMRDALSLLDQAATYGEGNVSEQVVEEFLGIVSQEKVREFLLLLLEGDVDTALARLRDLHSRGFSITKFWDSLEEEIRNLILIKSLKNPHQVLQVEEFHRKVTAPLNALLYLEKVISSARLDARYRDFLRACELAIIKSKLVRDILPLSELLNIGKVSDISPSLWQQLKSSLSSFDVAALERLRREEKEGKLIFYGTKEDLKVVEMEKIKARFPFVEFVEEGKKEEEGEIPPFVQKVKETFTAKVIKHERDKGKGLFG